MSCRKQTQHTQRVKFHCAHVHDTKSLARAIAELVGYYRYMLKCLCLCLLLTVWHLYREYHSRTPETLPRLRRWFTSRRHSSHRIQRSLSLRVHSSMRSQHTSSGVRNFATQSFSEADKIKVDRVSQDRAATPIVVTTKRFVSTTSLVSYDLIVTCLPTGVYQLVVHLLLMVDSFMKLDRPWMSHTGR